MPVDGDESFDDEAFDQNAFDTGAFDFGSGSGQEPADGPDGAMAFGSMGVR